MALMTLLLLAGLAGAPTPRVAVREGRFVERVTGQPYAPLGVNYYRTGKVSSGKVSHATFCAGFYDRAYVEQMMATVAAWGFTTVRTFQVYHVGAEGILRSSDDRQLAPDYLANVVHFLQQARRHGLHVILTWDIWLPPSTWWSTQPLPGEAEHPLPAAWQADQGLNNFRWHAGSVRTRANAIVALIEALRQVDADLLPVVMAWELENEVYFTADRAPWRERQGSFRFGGQEYRLDSDDAAQALMDDAFVQWADLCAGAIRRADPEALVSCGVFSFAAVGRGGPGTLSQDRTKDTRVPARPLAVLRSTLDYVDLHSYAWRSAGETVAQHLERNLVSVEWERLSAEAKRRGKPILAGESGVFANYLRRQPGGAIDHELGRECWRDLLLGLRRRGFAGTLYWHYGNPDSRPNDEHPVLALFGSYADLLRGAWVVAP